MDILILVEIGVFGNLRACIQSPFFRHFRTFSVRISGKLVKIPPVSLLIFQKSCHKKASEITGKEIVYRLLFFWIVWIPLTNNFNAAVRVIFIYAALRWCSFHVDDTKNEPYSGIGEEHRNDTD